MDPDAGPPYRCQRRDLRRVNRRAPAQNPLTGAHVLPTDPDVLTSNRLPLEGHLSRALVLGSQLDHDDGVRAGGNRASGHDADAASGIDPEITYRPSRAHLAREVQGAAGLPDVLPPHREAVHGGAVGGRKVPIGGHVLGQHPRPRVIEIDLDDVEPLRFLENPSLRFFNINHRTLTLPEEGDTLIFSPSRVKRPCAS
jgi:hypothetical protein